MGDHRRRRRPTNALRGPVSAAGGLWKAGYWILPKSGFEIRQWQNGTPACEFRRPGSRPQRAGRWGCRQWQNGTRACEFGRLGSCRSRSRPLRMPSMAERDARMRIRATALRAQREPGTGAGEGRHEKRACVDSGEPPPSGTRPALRPRRVVAYARPDGPTRSSRRIAGGRPECAGTGPRRQPRPPPSEYSCSTGPWSRSSALPRPDRLGLFMK